MAGYSRDTYIHVGLPHRFHGLYGLYGLSKSLQEQLGDSYVAEHGMIIPALRP